MMGERSGGRVLNLNVGVVGHVDSGKTSLCRTLSDTASTAAFDKNPQSKERGITLDLGFSSFTVPAPEHVRSEGQSGAGYDHIQFTLVDCPGHASLIRTIIGGAQIIDLMLLVIDINKGIQTQTAECLVIGQITTEHMIIALNKIDMIPSDKRQQVIDKMCKRLRKTLESTPFSTVPIIPVSAIRNQDDISNHPDKCSDSDSISDLVSHLCRTAYIPHRIITAPFIMSVDHCFSIRGQGTVMTGTVLHGQVNINDNIEIPSIKLTRKVKSIQMFKQPVKTASQGERCGVCVSQFDPSLLERGLACSPDSVPTVYAVITSIHKIRHYKAPCNTNAKFHISIGHETVMGKATFFSRRRLADECNGETKVFHTDVEYQYSDELLLPDVTVGEDGATSHQQQRVQFALIEFDHCVTCPAESLVIGSKLDTDIHANTCRLAFHGRVLVALTDRAYRETYLPGCVRVSKVKCKDGVVERVADQSTVICKGMFKRETNMQQFVGMKVSLSTGEVGHIEGTFGQGGKFKVRVNAGLSPTTLTLLASRDKKGKQRGKHKNQDDTRDPNSSTNQTSPPAASTNQEAVSADNEPIRVKLEFKRYLYDAKKKMIQN